MQKHFFTLFLGLLSFGILSAQNETPPQNWFHLDYASDGYFGISTAQAYDLLKGKKGETVVVAIIDSGVEAEHEDLQPIMWVNEDEIAGNGVDDDKNGYIDDVHGWNFIGNANGENVKGDNLEMTRQYVKLKAKYEDADPDKLKKKQKAEYERYKEYEKTIADKKKQFGEDYMLYQQMVYAFDQLESAIKPSEGEIDDEILQKSTKKEGMIGELASVALQIMGESGLNWPQLMEELETTLDYVDGQLNYYYNPDLNSRSIVGDDYSNPNERYYGNGDVEGPYADHGTHVAGIVAAARNNGLGMNGVADNVRIMSIRTVPKGDERDKDVANAIRYAVDNGAQVINMSFGKGLSPNKKVVDDAVRYAMKNDVLLVHGAGNDNREIQYDDNYPNDRFAKKGLFRPRYAEAWIEVGASTWTKDKKLAADFSNYSPDKVDIFAPGVEIYSTVTDGIYKKQQGTSMAAPVVAGVAAALRSYFPELSAEEVKSIIMESAVPVRESVIVPGETDLSRNFSRLSVTGGVVNFANAVRLAQQRS